MKKIALVTTCLLSLSLHGSEISEYSPISLDSTDYDFRDYSPLSWYEELERRKCLEENNCQCDSLFVLEQKESEKSNQDQSEESYQNDNEESDLDEKDYKYHSDLSNQAISMLEKAYEKYDSSWGVQKKRESSRHTAQQMVAAQPRQHEKRAFSVKRIVNPFKEATPDLLGNQPLGQRKNIQAATGVVRRQKESALCLHDDVKRRQVAFERGQAARQLTTHIAPQKVLRVVALVTAQGIK